MKDTQVLPPDADANSAMMTSDDWVVIHRRNTPRPSPAEARQSAGRASEPRRVVPRPVLPVAEPKDTAPIGRPAVAATPAPAPAALVETAPAPRAVAPVSTVDEWQNLKEVKFGKGWSLVGRKTPTLVEFSRADPIAKGFDLLRTRLVRTIRAYGWKKIAVVAPTSGCGTTFTAVNLALSLSRVPATRTLLMDLNQRRPGVAAALGVRKPGRMQQFLAAETALEDFIVRSGDTLGLGLSDASNEFAAETLHDPLTAEVLDEMIDTLDPDLVIYDMPPMLEFDDMAAFLSEVDGVLLVSDGTQTTPEHIAACERILEDQTQLLGVVLNRARSGGDVGGTI